MRSRRIPTIIEAVTFERQYGPNGTLLFTLGAAFTKSSNLFPDSLACSLADSIRRKQLASLCLKVYAYSSQQSRFMKLAGCLAERCVVSAVSRVAAVHELLLLLHPTISHQTWW